MECGENQPFILLHRILCGVLHGCQFTQCDGFKRRTDAIIPCFIPSLAIGFGQQRRHGQSAIAALTRAHARAPEGLGLVWSNTSQLGIAADISGCQGYRMNSILWFALIFYL